MTDSHRHTAAEIIGLEASTFARTLLDDADQAAAQATLGVVPGTNVQAWDADLDGLAALTGTNVYAYRAAITGAWTTQSITTLARLLLTRSTAALMRTDLEVAGNHAVAATLSAPTLTVDMTTRPALALYTGATWGGNRTIDVSNAAANMVEGDEVMLVIKDQGSSRTLTWSSNFVAPTGITQLAATVAGKKSWAPFVWDDDDNKFVQLANFVTRP